MVGRRTFLAALPATAASLLHVSCSSAPPPVKVSTKTSTEQSILGEILAQHLEKSLARPVDRRFRLGGTLIVYQALQNGEADAYPEYTGSIITEILREQPGGDGDRIFERARGEMLRVGQAQLFNPLGFSHEVIGVIRADDPRAGRVSNLSDAVRVSDGWKVAVTFEFQQTSDGMPSLTQYHLPMSAPIHAVDSDKLFASLEEGQASMIFTSPTQAALENPAWKVLADDQKLFTPSQPAFVARQAALSADPRLGAAIGALSGKFTTLSMRTMNADVELRNRAAADVAREFLSKAGIA